MKFQVPEQLVRRFQAVSFERLDGIDAAWVVVSRDGGTPTVEANCIANCTRSRATRVSSASRTWPPSARSSRTCSRPPARDVPASARRSTSSLRWPSSSSAYWFASAAGPCAASTSTGSSSRSTTSWWRGARAPARRVAHRAPQHIRPRPVSWWVPRLCRAAGSQSRQPGCTWSTSLLGARHRAGGCTGSGDRSRARSRCSRRPISGHCSTVRPRPDGSSRVTSASSWM